MTIGKHHARDGHLADAFLAALADSVTGPCRPVTHAPAGTLTPDDETMLRELERSDGAFIDNLVEEVWGDTDRLDVPCVSDDQAPEEDRPAAKGGPRPDDRAERLAQAIVSDWAWAVIDSGHQAPAHRWACWKHSAALCHPSHDYDLLIKVLDLDAACADALCWSAAPDRQLTCLNVICCICLAEAPGRTSRLLRERSAYYDAWDRFLVTSLAPRRGAAPSRLWSMVDGVARTFRVETYDRANVLRLLLGGFGKRVLFSGLGEHLFPGDWSDDRQSDPEVLKDIGSSFIDYFRECSRVFVASPHGCPSDLLSNVLLAAAPKGCGPRSGVPSQSRGAGKLLRPALHPPVLRKETCMPKVTFFPLGNADTTLLDLADGQKILFDYANRRNPDDEDDKRADLPAELRKDLGSRDYYDVVAFTHLDQDHYDGMTEFFYLDHSKDYQGKVGGRDRIKIKTMWVPAAVITEEMTEEESKVVQAEARYRLKKKRGIRVFSRPERLEGWLKDNGMKLDDVRDLITDAGRTIPGFSQHEQGVEFFVHSPFATRQNEHEVEVRNDDALVVQASFLVGGAETKLLLFADLAYDVIVDIVNVTRYHERDHRLEWDIFKVAHHCSYTALGEEKGDDQTVPADEVDWLFREQGRRGGVIVSTSKPIPRKGTDEDEDVQPPHRQAANYYREVAGEKDGEFIATMEHPKASAPKALVIEIDGQGHRVKKAQVIGAAAVASTSAPRAG